MDDRSNEPTATDERIAENRTPARRIPVTRREGDTDPETGLPPGMHDDDRSPLDAGGPLDPVRVRHRDLWMRPIGTRTFREALDEHLSALQARDVRRFSATFGDDVSAVDGRGRITRGTDAVLRSHTEWFAAREPWTFDYEPVLTREGAGMALALIEVTYREGPAAPPTRFLLSLVFEREPNGAWKFVFDQNTPLA